MAWTTPRTYTTGEVITAATLNTDHRDNLAVFEAWTTYTPTWTAVTTNPAIGNGTLSGAYANPGKTLFLRVKMKAGSTTTFGSGVWAFALPPGMTAKSGVTQVTSAWALDTGTANYLAVARVGEQPGSYTKFDVVVGSGQFGAALPFTWTTNDELAFEGVIELA